MCALATAGAHVADVFSMSRDVDFSFIAYVVTDPNGSLAAYNWFKYDALSCPNKYNITRDI
jgi:hypothetical protein